MNELPDALFKTWGSRFKEEILSPDVKEDVVQALLHHLADLGIFHTEDGLSWSMLGLDVFPARSDIIKRLENLFSTEKGFVIGFFLAHDTDGNPPDNFSDLPDFLKMKKNFEGQELNVKRPSDLSNLQIVKNTAGRIQPFLELEKTCLDKLEGPNTTRGDAKKLFNYILSKIYPKAKPIKWQQLSRRRHRKG